MDSNTTASSSSSAPELRPFEQFAAEKGTPAWQLAGAAAHEGWPAGREVTEAQFDAAVERFSNLSIR